MITLNLERFKEIDITQRDNDQYKTRACLPSSAAIAIDFLCPDFRKSIGCQTADWLVRKCLSLTEEEKKAIIEINKSSWMFDDPSFELFQAIPIEAYVIKKYIYKNVWPMWRCQYSDILDSINRGIPIVCLGNFSPISTIGGHYNCTVGYNKESNTVINMDTWGNGNTNYKDKNGFAVEYDWKIFLIEQGLYGYGLWFK